MTAGLGYNLMEHLQSCEPSWKEEASVHITCHPSDGTKAETSLPQSLHWVLLVFVSEETICRAAQTHKTVNWWQKQTQGKVFYDTNPASGQAMEKWVHSKVFVQFTE